MEQPTAPTRQLGLGAFTFEPIRDAARLYLDAGLIKTQFDPDRYFTNQLIGRL